MVFITGLVETVQPEEEIRELQEPTGTNRSPIVDDVNSDHRAGKKILIWLNNRVVSVLWWWLKPNVSLHVNVRIKGV